MPIDNNFIVAIELGSSKVTALAGRKEPDGAIHVLAYVQEPSESFIRKGRINNINKMIQCISNIKEKLEKKLQKTISRVYVGIGGMGMHTVSNTVTRQFPEKTIITTEIIDNIADTNRAASTTEREILEAVQQEYKLGTQQQLDPVGIPTECIEGHFLNIVANASMREDVLNCFRTAGVGIADLPITVLALANIMLTESEKRSGCVFVDMGAETTSVAVFKNNLLRHLAVIPLGGANINRDIASLQIEDKEAEALKLRYGTAFLPVGDDDTEEPHDPIKLEDGRLVSHEELCRLIEARMEEIILNVNHQIELSGYDKSLLIGGLVATGGASHIKDIEKAFETFTGFSKMRFVNKGKLTLRPNSSEFNRDGSFNGVLAIIDEAQENCCGGNIGDNVPDIFEAEERRRKEKELEEKKREEEELQRQAEEEERRRKEQEEAEEQMRKARKSAKWKKTWRKIITFATNVVSEEDNMTPTRQEDNKEE